MGNSNNNRKYAKEKYRKQNNKQNNRQNVK